MLSLPASYRRRPAFDDAAFAFRAALFAGALCAPAADESVNESASAAHTVADDFASFIVFALRRLFAGAAAGAAEASAAFVKKVVIVNVPVTEAPGGHVELTFA